MSDVYYDEASGVWRYNASSSTPGREVSKFDVSKMINPPASSSSSSSNTSSASSNTASAATPESYLSQLFNLSPEMAAQNYKMAAKYAPQYAALDYQNQLKYQPLMAQLGLNIQKKYAPGYQSLAETLRTSDRGADIRDVSNMTPELEAIRRASEGVDMTNMRTTLMNQILGDLSAGENLTPEQARIAEQNTRTAESARGLSGQGSANREAVQKALAGRKLKAERQNAAGNYMTMDAQQRIDPFMAIAGRPATAMTTAGGNLNANAAKTPVAQTPTNADAFNLMNLAQQGNQFAATFDQDQQRYDLQYQLAKNNAAGYGINF